MLRSSCICACVVCAFLTTVVGQAQAALILQPVSVTAPSENGTALAVHMIDQSGLSAGYTSLVTDFDAFLASATHSGISTFWSNVPFVTFPLNLDFDLGGTFLLGSLGMWNFDRNQATQNFNLYAANNSGFAGATLIGNFNATQAGSNPYLGEVFSFAPTTASFVRIEILSNHGSTIQVAVSEVAFELASAVVVAIPEPATATLGMLSLGGLMLRRRRMA